MLARDPHPTVAHCGGGYWYVSAQKHPLDISSVSLLCALEVTRGSRQCSTILKYIFVVFPMAAMASLRASSNVATGPEMVKGLLLLLLPLTTALH